MSKPSSGLFEGTSGELSFYGDAEDVIAKRAKGLDLTPHPIQQKELSAKQKSALRTKVAARTASKAEYKLLRWQERLDSRRSKGVKAFWDQERNRLVNGLPGTRNWTPEMAQAIVAHEGNPKFNGKAVEAHHTYAVRLYPQLANQGEIIYPATHYEHLKGWHGGSYRKSLPGRRIRKINEF